MTTQEELFDNIKKLRDIEQTSTQMDAIRLALREAWKIIDEKNLEIKRMREILKEQDGWE